MTVEEITQFFEEHESEFLEFDRVEDKLSKRADLHAFLLLESLCPGDRDMVCAADHDEIWLAPTLEDVAAAATEAQLIDLIRCGVRIWDEEAFAMHV